MSKDDFHRRTAAPDDPRTAGRRHWVDPQAATEIRDDRAYHGFFTVRGIARLEPGAETTDYGYLSVIVPDQIWPECRADLMELNLLVGVRGGPAPLDALEVFETAIVPAARSRGLGLALYLAALKHAAAQETSAALVPNECGSGSTSTAARATWERLRAVPGVVSVGTAFYWLGEERRRNPPAVAADAERVAPALPMPRGVALVRFEPYHLGNYWLFQLTAFARRRAEPRDEVGHVIVAGFLRPKPNCTADFEELARAVGRDAVTPLRVRHAGVDAAWRGMGVGVSLYATALREAALRYGAGLAPDACDAVGSTSESAAGVWASEAFRSVATVRGHAAFWKDPPKRRKAAPPEVSVHAGEPEGEGLEQLSVAVAGQEEAYGSLEYGPRAAVARYLDGRGLRADAACARTLRGSDPVGYLSGLEVPSGARGEGLGGRMLDAILARADEVGVSAIFLDVVPSPPATLETLTRFYRKHGFAPWEGCRGVFPTMIRRRPATARRPNPPACGKLVIRTKHLPESAARDGLNDEHVKVTAEYRHPENGWMGDATAYVGTRGFVAQWAPSVWSEPVGPYAFLVGVEIEAGMRRQGCGRRLLVALFRKLRAKGVRGVYLEAAPFHGGPPVADLVRFYESMGFEQVRGPREMSLLEQVRGPREMRLRWPESASPRARGA